jgi:hypothetical protein
MCTTEWKLKQGAMAVKGRPLVLDMTRMAHSQQGETLFYFIKICKLGLKIWRKGGRGLF